MQKVKKTIKTALAGILLAGAFAVPASAQTTNTSTVNQDCSVSIANNATQVASNNNGATAGGTGVGVGVGVVGSGSGTGTGGSASTTQSNSQAITNNVSTNCSNVTNIHQAQAQAQVKKSPRGAVHAGAGGASTEVSAASIVGVVGSVVTMGAGLVLRRQGFEL